LRQRLQATEPSRVETREEFLVRLRRTVTWLNENKQEDGAKLCTNQKERAQDCLDLDGARTKW
jgi:hypothetical protein